MNCFSSNEHPIGPYGVQEKVANCQARPFLFTNPIVHN